MKDWFEFEFNVETWARIRGIYEGSTEAHQQAKALEEIGEYLTAETIEEKMDAIGDIAVCIVNAKHIGYDLDISNKACSVVPSMGIISALVVSGDYRDALHHLKGIAGLSWWDCLDMAWNEIKDRKGMMINKKYVKWDNLNEEQREEFTKREEERK